MKDRNDRAIAYLEELGTESAAQELYARQKHLHNVLKCRQRAIDVSM
jgi:hypothetical protein